MNTLPGKRASLPVGDGVVEGAAMRPSWRMPGLCEAKSAAAQFGHRAVEISATHVLAQCIAALDPRELARPIFLLRAAIENATDIGAAPAALACCETARSILLAHGRRAEAVDLCRRAVAMAEQARWRQATTRFRALMDEAGDLPSRIASG